MKDVRKRFTGIDDILQGGAAEAPSGDKERQAGVEMSRTSLELPLSLHIKVKKYAIDMKMKDKQVMVSAIQDFFERLERK